MHKAALTLSRTTLALLLCVLVAQTAEARKRRHHYGHDADLMVATPNGRALERAARKGDRRRSPPIPLAAVVPPGWKLQPPESNWEGKRFLSPDGAASLALYKAPAGGPVADHMKSVAFACDGETLTYLQGERSWIAAAGYKGSRMFYRKAVLACAGRVWHHIAFEYPPEINARLQRFIVLAAEGLDDSQTDCDEAVAERQQ